MSEANRRTVLSAAGLAAAGGIATLAGCSSATPSGPATGSSPAPTGAPSSTGTTSGPSATGGSATGGSSTGGAATGPSVPVSQVPEGGGVILPDADYVVTQPTAGQFKAFSKVCTHKQCPVSAIEGGTINCNCHGSKFSITDGSVTSGPAEQPLAAATAVVSGDRVVVTG